MGLFDKTQTQTTTQQLDPISRHWLGAARNANQNLFDVAGGPGSFYADAVGLSDIQGLMPGLMNPYMQQVIGGVGSQFDKLRGQATLGANQAATSAGAYGSSRHGVLEAERLGNLDQQQMAQVAGLLSGQYNNAMGQAMGLAQGQQNVNQMRAMEPLMRAQIQQQAMQNYGPLTGDVSQTNTQQGNAFTGLLGLGTTLASTFLNPAGAATSGALNFGAGDAFRNSVAQPLFGSR